MTSTVIVRYFMMSYDSPDFFIVVDDYCETTERSLSCKESRIQGNQPLSSLRDTTFNILNFHSKSPYKGIFRVSGKSGGDKAFARLARVITDSCLVRYSQDLYKTNPIGNCSNYNKTFTCSDDSPPASHRCFTSDLNSVIQWEKIDSSTNSRWCYFNVSGLFDVIIF